MAGRWLPPLLTSRRLAPLFVTQALGALNDNLLRNALAVMALWQATAHGPLLVNLGVAAFILPYVLFSSLAGQIADKVEKARLVRFTSYWEASMTVIAAIGFVTGNLGLLLAVLFGSGMQSAFFSPVKYGILPQHLAEEELVEGNGLIEAGTFIAILLGTILGSALIQVPYGTYWLPALSLCVVTGTVLTARWVPPAPAGAPDLRIGWNIFTETMQLLRLARAQRGIWLSILGVSWFWAFGATVLSQLTVLAKTTLGGEASVLTVLLAFFTVGIGIGSLLSARLLHGDVSARHVPFACFGMSLFTWDFANACQAAAGHLLTATDVLTHLHGWRLIIDLILLAICGGIYSVPLNAIVQDLSPLAERARIIAANAVLNAAMMVASAAAASGLTYFLGLDAPEILLVLAATNFGVAIWIVRILPQDSMRAVLRWYFVTFHQVEVRGLENLRAAGERALFVVNHLSLADGGLVAAFVPGHPTFAVNTVIAGKWWARPFLAPLDIFEVDPTNPYAAKGMIRAVEAGKRLVIFPEGRLTRTGSLMKIYEGAGLIADKAGAMILPVRIDGLQFTPLSRMPGRVRRRWFPPLAITILPPVRLEIDPGILGRARRRALADALHDVMAHAVFSTEHLDRSLFAALCVAVRRYGARTEIADDLRHTPLRYGGLLRGAAVLGRHVARHSAAGEAVGLLLPNASAALVTFFALQAFARVPAMLNHTTGADGMLSTCRTARVKTIVSSREFVRRAKLQPAIARMMGEINFIWLEDIRPQIGIAAKLRGLWDVARVHRLPGHHVAADRPGVILFTSGSEGAPKAVVLSHRNILAVCAQLSSVMDFSPADRVLNAMPMFHSFGLNGGALLPVLCGVRIFFYPSPLHYRMVPEVVYDSDATIVFGTDTFLAGWARFAHPYDFRSIHSAFGGAEKIRPETRAVYMERFGVRILEGYGATETAAVIAVNTAMHNRTGTVGRILPGMEWRLEPVPDLHDGGRLYVRGPNVMLGYYRADKPGVIEPPADGWYDTGDIVSIDGDGFVTIKGRARRFAKIAGEMISLAACEELAQAVWPQAQHAVLARPDPRKGEQLVLLTTQQDAMVPQLLAAARERGIAEVMVARQIEVRPALPLLGTGKIDYPKLMASLAPEAGASARV